MKKILSMLVLTLAIAGYSDDTEQQLPLLVEEETTHCSDCHCKDHANTVNTTEEENDPSAALLGCSGCSKDKDKK